MGFSRTDYIRYRPYLYHYTPVSNVTSMRSRRTMYSAAKWVELANLFQAQIPNVYEYLGVPRDKPETLFIGNDTVTLNDQEPLRSRDNFHELCGTHEDFVRYLNGLVFFWPGTADGPKPRHELEASFSKRYASYGCLRVPTSDVWHNAGRAPKFCKYNSGAPTKRDRIERGSHIFIAHYAFPTAKDVAEVVFEFPLALPESSQWRKPGSNQWNPIFP
jgi:hypothetical protein